MVRLRSYRASACWMLLCWAQPQHAVCSKAAAQRCNRKAVEGVLMVLIIVPEFCACLQDPLCVCLHLCGMDLPTAGAV